jgi:hypothetical protein
MPESTANQIAIAEERLRLAMLGSDVDALDELISPNLIFTTHLGSVITKEDDLAIHRSGTLKFQAIELSEQRGVALGHAAYVSVRARLTGVFGGSSFQDDIRFSRVWQLSNNNVWQVVAGQATVVKP